MDFIAAESDFCGYYENDTWTQRRIFYKMCIKSMTFSTSKCVRKVKNGLKTSGKDSADS